MRDRQRRSAVGINELTLSHPTVPVGERMTLTSSGFTRSAGDCSKTSTCASSTTSAVLWVRFNEPSNSFSLFHPESVASATRSPRAARTLRDQRATLYLEETRAQGSGPTGPSVTLTYSISVQATAAGAATVWRCSRTTSAISRL